jgi:hypothetical protein
MRKYRAEAPSVVEPAPTVAAKLPSYAMTSTRFQLDDHPIYPRAGSLSSTWSVEDEFTKYISSPIVRFDILKYWEARISFRLNFNIS